MVSAMYNPVRKTWCGALSGIGWKTINCSTLVLRALLPTPDAPSESRPLDGLSNPLVVFWKTMNVLFRKHLGMF